MLNASPSLVTLALGGVNLNDRLRLSNDIQGPTRVPSLRSLSINFSNLSGFYFALLFTLLSMPNLELLELGGADLLSLIPCYESTLDPSAPHPKNVAALPLSHP